MSLEISNIMQIHATARLNKKLNLNGDIFQVAFERWPMQDKWVMGVAKIKNCFVEITPEEMGNFQEEERLLDKLAEIIRNIINGVSV